MTARELAASIDSAGGVKTYAMDELLSLIDAQYMSKHAPGRIAQELEDVGLRFWPRPLPQDRWALVRLFTPSSKAGELVRAVLEPDEQSDDLIRHFTEQLSSEAKKKLEVATSTGLTHERVLDTVQSIPSVQGHPVLRVAAAQAVEAVSHIGSDQETGSELRSNGIRFQAVGRAIHHVLPDFDEGTYGFSTLREFMQCALARSPYAVAMSEAEAPHARLVSRDSVPTGYELLPDLDGD